MNTFWKVFLGLLTIGVIVSLVTLFNGSQPVGSENLVGLPLPDFAAPLASGTLNGDANVYTPAQAKAAKSTAACDVDLPGSFNSCDDLKGESIVAFWNSTKSECTKQISVLNDFVAEHKNVSAVAVAFDQSESAVREFVVKQNWKVPVAIDRDGAVAALYAVAGCPSIFFSENGTITGVKLGTQTSAQLEAGVRTSSGGATGATD
jgi:peroxiredoxin